MSHDGEAEECLFFHFCLLKLAEHQRGALFFLYKVALDVLKLLDLFFCNGVDVANTTPL